MKFTIKDIRSRAKIPSWGNGKKFLGIHYLGVDGQNNDIEADGCGAHYYIYWDGTIYWRCDHDAIVYQVGTANGQYIQKHPVARNANTIGIEMCCHCDGNAMSAEDHKWWFTEATQEACVWLVQKLMAELNIPIENVLRHFDIVNKTCPAPYVHNNAYRGTWTWEQFRAKVAGGEVHLYRVRLKWELPGTQIGAYYILDNAKANCPVGYSVYDENGKLVWTNTDAVSSAQPGKYPSGIPASKEAYIESVGPICREMQKETGILAEVVVAMACLEPGFGLGADSVELVKVNNILGMKTDLINSTWKDYTVWDGKSISKVTPEYHNGKLVYITDSFRAYRDYENCIRDCEMFLLHVKNDKGYKYRRIQGWTDPKEVIHAIRIGTGTNERPEGYCTDPNYEQKILDLIKQYNLSRFNADAGQSQEEQKQEETKVSKPKTIIDCMKIFQKQMRADIKAGKVWRYYNSHTSGSFDAAERDQNLRANCATIANWALRKLKVFKAGNYFWGRLGGTLACSDVTLAVLKANCRLIHVNGKKTVGQLIKDGTLQAGDIVTYMDIQHTNVYAGDGKWYDAGHAYCKESGEGAKFITWHGKTVYSDQRVAYIIRYKGNATPEPKKQTVYRVQVGAYKTKASADKRAAAVTKKTKGIIHEGKKIKDGYPCFVEGTDWWRTFCGSFEDRNNAVIRQEELATVGLKKDKDTIIVEHQAK